jgi:uncharacterized protein YqhQ
MKQNRTEDEIKTCKKMTTIGGQALMEGLMMIGPSTMAMAVRKGNGSIHVETSPVGKASKAAKIPFVRGSVKIFRQMVTGTSYLMKSAEFAEEAIDTNDTAGTNAMSDTAEEAIDTNDTAGTNTMSDTAGTDDTIDTIDTIDTSSPNGRAAEEGTLVHIPSVGDALLSDTSPTPERPAPAEDSGKQGFKRSAEQPSTKGKGSGWFDRFFEKHTSALLYLSVVFGILLSVGLFILLPNLISSLTINRVLDQSSGFGYQVLRSLFEGIIRIGIFVAYLALASRMKDIKRVWMYHGAEHKTIACYESRLPLTVPNVRGFSKHHPRCGTTFMFIVLLVSIILFSFVPRINLFVDMLIRLALVPLLAGLSYELIHVTARYNNVFTNALSWPGLMLQRLTTKEPDDSMIEVAIAAMLPVIPAGERGDEW